MILSPNIFLTSDLGAEIGIESEADLRAQFFASKLRNSVLYVDSPDGPVNDWFAHRRWIAVAKSYRNRGSLLPTKYWSELDTKFRDLVLYANVRPKTSGVEVASVTQLTTTRVWHNTVETLDVRRSEREFTTLFVRQTHHASTISVVDPYLDLASERQRFRWIFDAIKAHRTPIPRSITLHVDANTKHIDDTTSWIKNWFDSQGNNNHDSITIVVWRDLHDRFLMTERHVTTVGHGFGLAGANHAGKTHTIWSILNENDAQIRRNQMDPRVSRTDGWPIHVRTLEIL